LAALGCVLALVLVAAHKPGTGLSDRDADRIPDQHDPFPDDPDKPGKATPQTVYAHTASTLFRVSKAGADLVVVGDFRFSDGTARQVTDIAIDRWGVAYVVAFDSFHTCNPQTARCETLGRLPGSFNALTIVPPEVFGTASDGLLGVTTDGRWYRVQRDGGAAELGSHGAASSGDAYTLGGQVRASADTPTGIDALIEFDPRRRDSVRALGSLPGQTMYGFAACADRVFAFDADGSVYESRGSSFVLLAKTAMQWWGAACSGPEIEFEAAAPGDETGGAQPKAAQQKQGDPTSEGRGCGCG
jgi:hypothetical protein